MQKNYTTIISTFIINNNCVEITINEDAVFDLSSVKKHFEQVYEIIKKPYSKTFIDFSNVSFLSVPKESMQYMANNEYTNNNSSLAIIINGLPQKLIGNFYLNVMKPKRKTKFFTSKKMAISWLNTIDETTSA